MEKFKIVGNPLPAGKWTERKKEKERRRLMPSLVATTSALAHTTCVRTHYVRTKKMNNDKFSGHYVRPRTHNMRAHALRSHQNTTPFYTYLKIYQLVELVLQATLLNIYNAYQVRL